MKNLAIIGTGPTAIYLLKALIESNDKFKIILYEQSELAGVGTPYSGGVNSNQMLANIGSIEIPPIHETYFDWLMNLEDSVLKPFSLDKSLITERGFYPRILLGMYLKNQLEKLIAKALSNGNKIEVHNNSHVYNVEYINPLFEVSIKSYNFKKTKELFDYVVMATGHFYDNGKDDVHLFASPWPYRKLELIKNTSVGILGTSLSAIDAFVAIAHNHGTFEEDPAGQLIFANNTNISNLKIVMMSRKGILPEADFYCPIPYEPLEIFTEELVENFIHHCPYGLLEETFKLFKMQLVYSDPEYSKSINLEGLCMPKFKEAYFGARMVADPFVWAKANLDEAVSNYSSQCTVAWRYAILRMHELFGRVIPHLSANELIEFNTFLKPVFVDDYASVPHESIKRLLAAHQSGILTVQKLPEDYTIENEIIENAVVVLAANYNHIFSYLIDATGNKPLSDSDFPFNSLSKQMQSSPETGAIIINDEFKIKNILGELIPFYCLSIPHILNKFPFMQGLQGSHYLASQAATDIINSNI